MNRRKLKSWLKGQPDRGSRGDELDLLSQSTHPLWTEDRNEPLLSRPSFGFPIIPAEIHVRTETCLKYHLVIVLDNIQDYAGRANKSFHCISGHGSTRTTAAFHSEPWRGKSQERAAQPRQRAESSCPLFLDLLLVPWISLQDWRATTPSLNISGLPDSGRSCKAK